MTFSGLNSVLARLQEDDAVIERHGVEHDREARALIVREGGADAYPGAAAIGFALHGVSDEHGSLVMVPVERDLSHARRR